LTIDNRDLTQRAFALRAEALFCWLFRRFDKKADISREKVKKAEAAARHDGSERKDRGTHEPVEVSSLRAPRASAAIIIAGTRGDGAKTGEAGRPAKIRIVL